jgi:predicted Zn-dependent protease with MMP-like domain
MHTLAPSLDDIERIARAAMAALPAPFAGHLGDIVLRIEDFPDDATCDDMGLESPFDLTGLYRGTPVGMRSVEYAGTVPDMITLYRRPLLDEWADTGVGLESLISHVIVHEVGHHFGLSDADMAAIEAAAG